MSGHPLRRLALAASIGSALLIATVPGTAGAAPPAPGNQQGNQQGNYRPAGCNAAPDDGHARCYAEGLATPDGRLVQDAEQPPATALGPADIRSAYDLPDGGSGRTVAIVDAFGYGNAESDLAVFRAHYGLAPCGSDDGCFTKVDQDGGTDYPAENGDWSVETALDLDAVSAACPGCKILLVQADDASIDDLGAAVDTAAGMGAVAISNSYGVAGEVSYQTDYDHHYDHPGIAVTVASGDLGGLQSWPATNPNVVAVGGTTLTRDTSARGWHESAWDGAGSGCSLYEARPDYQRDIATGCPDTKATADISADASPASGLAVYNTLGQDGWAQWGGTSLASPLVAAMYALAGTPVPGTYPVEYPYRAGARLNDVTDGSAGFCDDLLCNAGPGWDGPTGLGTPNGVAALTLGSFGYVTGTITDAKRHKALAGVTVTAIGGAGDAFHAVTDAKGRYRLAAPAGSHRVVASKFGYRDRTVDAVPIAADASVVENFSLATIPTRGLAGTVKDGSGQGWPVYAKITIDGYPNGPIFTDPFTGRYEVDLPAGAGYTLHVAPVDLPGYATTTAQVEIPRGRSDVHHDVALAVDLASCAAAAGYAYGYHGVSTGFEGWSAAQDGWQVTDDAHTGKTWVFDDPGAKGNLTGASGGFAIVDNWYHPAAHDTSLVSPRADLTGQTDPVIGFDTYYYDYGFGDQDGDVYLSVDGGATWTDVWHAPDAFVQGHVEIPVPQAAGRSGVLVKFRFTGAFDNYWELDNVFVGSRSCDPTGGGLVTGIVRDGNTAAPLVGASVSAGDTVAITQATPEDAQLPDGYYWLFSPDTGQVPLTATARNYASSHTSAYVAAHRVARRDWRLEAGRLAVRPGAVSVRERQGETRYQRVRLTNVGTRSLHLSLVEQDRGFTPIGGQHRPTAPGAPLQRHKVATSAAAFAGQPQASYDVPPRPADAAWSNIGDYPTPIMDNLVADNDGVVYSVGGLNDSSITAKGYAYHPDSRAWTRIADLPQPLEAPVGAFVDGRLIVTGGWNIGGDAVSTTYSYDPGSDSWSQVADLPGSISAGAAASVGGQLYVVGGCTTGNCDPASTATYRYDGRTGTWTTLADYPQGVAFLACAGAGDGVICAGGLDPGSGQPSAATYQYVAGIDAWTEVADLPYTNWAMAYAGAGGKLQVVGGIVNGSASNQAAQFDPGAGTWSALPNANDARYRGGGACGLYKIGGAPFGFAATPFSEQLPGYDACIRGSDVRWLSESRTELDLAPGRSTTVVVALDSSAVAARGEYDARLAAVTDTPYPTQPMPIAMRVR